jgi:hypothetical protein
VGVSVATASWAAFSTLLFALAFGVTSERWKDPDGKLGEIR